MPLPPRPAPPDDTVRVVIKGTTLTHPWVAVLWLAVTATSRAEADLTSLMGQIMTSLSTHLTDSLPPTTSIDSVEGVWKTPGGGEIIGVNGSGFVGGSSHAQLNEAGAAYVVSWRINAYYRGGHPRTYLPGVLGDQVTNGSQISGSFLSGLHTRMLAILTDINAMTAGGITGVQLGTVSFQHANAWRTPPIFRPYIGVAVSNIIGTQRRRIRA